jgi:hypothetical protein
MRLTRGNHPDSERVLRRSLSLLSLMLVGLLLFLSSCQGAAQTTRQRATPTAKPSQTSSDVAATALKYDQQQAILQKMFDLSGWMWNVSLPTDRLVVYYGNRCKNTILSEHYAR